MQSYTAIIIGSGFGGQSAAIQLRKLGIEDFRLLERRSFMGGTWCQNRYPGAAVDVQSPLYSLSEEPYDWSQMFAERHELEAYTQHIIEKHGLLEKTELEANVTGVTWEEESDTWRIDTEDKGSFHAQFVINASGPLSTPVIPDFEGRDSFRGTSFHTNDWDENYDHRGKRIAVIGSGASAAQVIPAIAPDVQHLHVFQRTPHWVLPRPDHHFSSVERWLLRSKLAYRALRTSIYWALEYRLIAFKYAKWLLPLLAEPKARQLLRKQIPDTELRRKVTPDYTIGCKRVILSSTLYPTYMRDNVTLRTGDEGIGRITETGIETRDGQHVELDAIVYATGYDATDGAISYPVVGRDGTSLAECWAEYPHAYLGTAMPGFPNLFIVTGPNTGIGHTSALFIIESQMRYIAKCIQAVRKKSARSIEVTPEAEARYTHMIHSQMERTVWKTGGCHSWYQGKSGHVIAMFPGFSFTYRRLAAAFRPEHHAVA